MTLLFFMTGPTPVVPKSKRNREREPYSDEESDKVTPQLYLKKTDQIQDPVIKTKIELALKRRVKFEEERFITSTKGQRSLMDQGSLLFLRDGRLSKQTSSLTLSRRATTF